MSLLMYKCFYCKVIWSSCWIYISFNAACCKPQTKLTFLKLFYFDQHLALSWIIIKLQVLYNNAWFCKKFSSRVILYFFFFFKFYLLYRLIIFFPLIAEILYKLFIFITFFRSLSLVLNLFPLAIFIIKAACFAKTPNNLAVLTLTSLLVINFVLTINFSVKWMYFYQVIFLTSTPAIFFFLEKG